MLIFTFLLSLNVHAQEDPKPVYITITTMYRNLDAQVSIINDRTRQRTKGLKEFNEKVTMKNPFIKDYYPHRYAWGADSRDFMEAFLFDSMADLDKSSDKDDELIKAAWPKETDRKAFFDEMRKAFTVFMAIIFTATSLQCRDNYKTPAYQLHFQDRNGVGLKPPLPLMN